MSSLKRRACTLGFVLFQVLGADTSSATDYFVCDCGPESISTCVPGNDQDRGTTPATAWRTYEKIQGVFQPDLQAGDTVNFCRGGDLAPTGAYDDLKWRNYNSTAASPITIRDYTPSWATASAPVPIIRWEFNFNNDSNAAHKEGLVVQNLRLKGPGSQGVALLIYNDYDDVTFKNIEASGYDSGIMLSGCNGASGDACYANNVKIQNVSIHDNGSFGFQGGGTDLTIQDSTFHDNGFLGATGLKHNVYVTGGGAFKLANVKVLNNTLYNNLNNAGKCSSVSLVFHGLYSDAEVKGNHVYEAPGKAEGGCWGIALDHGYPEIEIQERAHIDSNLVENVGNIGIGATECIDCVIRNNVIRWDSAAFDLSCIKLPSKAPGDPEDGSNISTNVDIVNNSCYVNSANAGLMTGIAVGSRIGGTSWRVMNNAMKFSGLGSFECIDTPTDLSIFQAIDNNICNYSSGSWSSGKNLSGWQTTTTFDGASSERDPLFSLSDRLRLEAGSPAIDAGAAIGVALDINGALRDSHPDLGAWEFNAESSQAPAPPAAPLLPPVLLP